MRFYPRALIPAVLLGLLLVCGVSSADFPARFIPVPEEYRIRAVFDSITVDDNPEPLVYMGEWIYTRPAPYLFVADPRTEKVRAVDLSTVIADPPEYFWHGKIHCRLQCTPDGKIWFGTHFGHQGGTDLKEHPKGWSGGHLISYDPQTDQLTDHGIPAWKQSIMRMVVDHERQLVYIWTYPDAHFVIFNLEIRAPMDKGPVVKGVYYVQPWIGPDKNVYLVDTPSRVVRYHPDANTMEDLSPEGAEGLKWMRALAQSPDRAKVYGYAAEGDEIWLVELNLADGPNGTIKRLAPAPRGNLRHMDCGRDGTVWIMQRPSETEGDTSHLWRYDAESGELKDHGRAVLEGGEKSQWLWGLQEGMDGRLYICGQRSQEGRAAYGNFGVSGVFVVDPEDLK